MTTYIGNSITTSTGAIWNGASTYQFPIYADPVAAPAAPSKEIPMVAGAAPVKTLHTRYAQVKGGYVGQVRLRRP